MRLIARKPCRFNGKNFYIGDEIPADAVTDPYSQEKLGVLTIANLESENPDATYTQEDVDQKVQEAKKELEGQVEELTGQVSTLTQEKSTLESQITEKDAKIKELEGKVKELQEQVAAAASISADEMAKVSAAPTASTTSTKKKTADKAGEA